METNDVIWYNRRKMTTKLMIETLSDQVAMDYVHGQIVVGSESFGMVLRADHRRCGGVARDVRSE